jgi:hypothetical protein
MREEFQHEDEIYSSISISNNWLSVVSGFFTDGEE